MLEKLLGFVHLMRPLEWSKSFGNMAIAVIFAAINFGIAPDPLIFIKGFAAVILLWSGLYALNDWRDWKADAQHPVKRNRPIPSGLISPSAALIFAAALIAIAFFLGYFHMYPHNLFFLICLAAMFVNQVLYTTPPFDFKKRPILDLISGSAVNPFFRFYAGWVLLVPAFNASIFIVLFILGMQFGGFGLYRMASKKHEEKLNYRSSVVLFGEKNLKIIAYVSMALSALAFLFLALNNSMLFPNIEGFGFLPLRYLLLAALSLLTLPIYKKALKKPEEMDMPKMYRLLYIHYLLFIVGFIALYLVEF